MCPELPRKLPVFDAENGAFPRKTTDRLARAAREVLEAAWDEEAGYCFPNRHVYPHLWLWDSCFHAIAWLGLGDGRAVRELQAVFVGQLDNGFVPHMRYHQPTYSRGPLPAVSSYTQPPVYAHALALADRAGLRPDAGLLAAAERGLEALWSERQTSSGLLAIYHPWESGTDDSPRFDSWIGSSSYDRSRWRASDQELVRTTVFGAYGEAVGNEEFAVAPASFNAIAAHAAASLGQLLGRRRWTGRATQLAEALDARWDDGEGLWSDLPLTGGGASCAFPTLDGVLPALCSNDKVKCASALEQLIDQNRFGAPYGPAYVARTHPVYDPDEYWRGASWPQLNYLLIVAARRCGRNDIADQLAAALRRGCASSEFAEYWNPESGEGRGARPQTWAAVVAAV